MPPRKKPVNDGARQSIESIIADVNKKHNDPGLLVLGSQMDQVIERITSGIPGDDIALGGGYPVNQFHEIIGMESSGKTAKLLQMVAANQAIDPNWTVLWIAAEDFVPPWAACFEGLDLNRIVVMATNVMEEVYNTVLTAMDNRAVDCIVIDSYPALVAAMEDEQAMEDFAVGVGARLTGKFLRKGTRAQKRSLVDEDRSCTCFIINQWREKIGVMFGDPRTTPGGKAKNYHYFVRGENKRDEILRESDKKSPQVGISIGFTTLKNKSYRPNMSSVIDFYVTDFEEMRKGQFDIPRQVFAMSLAAEVIQKNGAWYFFDGEKLGQGAEASIKYLREDGAALIRVHAALFAHHLPGVVVPPLPCAKPKAAAPVKRAIKRVAKAS